MTAKALLLVAGVIWGWTFVATKVCLQVMAPMELLATRLLVAVPVLLAAIVARGGRLDFRGHVKRLLVGASCFTLHFVVQITGLQYTSATHTGWIVAVTPLALAVLSWWLLGERIGRRTVVGIAVATLGILVLVSRGGVTGFDALRSWGDWLILASAHTWALYTIAVRDLARARDAVATTLGVVAPAAAAASAWVSATSGWSFLGRLTLEATVAVLFLAILGTALAQWIWQLGIARIGAARAGVFLYVEPLATTALAVPYLGEPFTAATAAGGALVLAGVAYAQLRAGA